jgi:hypothetical protein
MKNIITSIVMSLMVLSVTMTLGQSSNSSREHLINTRHRFQVFNARTCAGTTYEDLQCQDFDVSFLVTVLESENTIKIYSKQYQQFDILDSTGPVRDSEGNYTTTMGALDITGKRCGILISRPRNTDTVVLQVSYQDYTTLRGTHIKLFVCLYAMREKK